MSYTPPAGNAVNFSFTELYSPPAGDAVDFSFIDSSAFEITINPTLPAITSILSVEYAPPIDVEISAQLPELSAAISLILDNARDLDIKPTLPALQAEVQIARGVVLSIATGMPAIQTGITLQWGETIPAATVTNSGSDAGKGFVWGIASTAQAEPAIQFNEIPEKQHSTQSDWDAGKAHDGEPEVLFGLFPEKSRESIAPWNRFEQQLYADDEMPSNYPQPTDLSKATPWDSFERTIDEDHTDPWNWPPPVDVDSLYPFHRVDLFGERQVWDTRNYTQPPGNAVNFSFTELYVAPEHDSVNFSWGAANPYTEEPARPADMGVIIPHDNPSAINESNRVTWGDGSWTRPAPDYEYSPGWEVEPEEDAPRPEQPAIREVYIFMPQLTLYRTPDGAEIEATNVSWATDSDSWGWRFTATIKKQSDLALLKPNSNGPREIACEINGHTFSGIVESYSVSRQFGQTGISIKGRSLSGYLSDPYAPKRSKAITAAYTAQQLAEQELDATGWTLDWQAQDWLIPGGAYSYQELDPIAAIKRLANTVGAIVQSHPTDKRLIVKPRYPVSPHKWGDADTVLDAILPASLMEQAGSQFKTLPTYNRAITAGGKTGGVIVTLTRDGTAGDELAPLVTDELITHQNAGYERARIEIAKGGTWEEMTFTTWLTEHGVAPGLLLPGHLVEIQDIDETYPVLISGTTISAQSTADSLTVRQQLAADRRVNV